MAFTLGLASVVVDLSATANFPVSPQIDLSSTNGFTPRRWSIAMKGGAGTDSISISFDGVTVHGYMVYNANMYYLKIPCTYKQMWLKGVAAGAMSAIVHVSSEAED